MTAPRFGRMIRASMTLLAVCAWFGLILQLFLSIAQSRARGMSVALAIFNYFSFFTILTNLLIAFGLSCSLWRPNSRLGRFSTMATVQSALAVYIVIVGLVYALALRQLWNPEGLQKIADVILHQLIPVLYGVYWLIFVSQIPLPWKSVLPWLLYPSAYLCFALIRGALSGWYPYPFIDAGALGYGHAALNVAGLYVVLLAFGLCAVGLSRWRGRKGSRKHQAIPMA